MLRPDNIDIENTLNFSVSKVVIANHSSLAIIEPGKYHRFVCADAQSTTSTSTSTSMLAVRAAKASMGRLKSPSVGKPTSTPVRRTTTAFSVDLPALTPTPCLSFSFSSSVLLSLLPSHDLNPFLSIAGCDHCWDPSLYYH
jgi:hypothetical protein